MNKFKTILYSIMMILVLMTISVYAAEPELQITGENEAEAGATGTLIVNLVSEEDIGVFSGKVAGDANIDGIEISGENGWSILANKEGSFKLVNAEGGKNEDILKINYTIKPEATGTANVTLSNIELTTIDYEAKTLTDITKEITIKTEQPDDNNDNKDEEEKPTPVEIKLMSIKVTSVPKKVKYTEGEKFNPEGLEITATYSDGTTKIITDYTYTPNGALTKQDDAIVISYTEDGVTKTIEQKITVEEKEEEKEEKPTNTNTTNTNTTNTTVTNTTITNDKKNNTQKQNTVTIVTSNPQKDNTVADKQLSKAGIGNFVFYATMIIATIGSVFYIKYTRMKDVQ